MHDHPTPSPQLLSEHHLEWNERLLDWLDNDVAEADGAVFETHLRDCSICQQQLAAFEELDAALSATSTPMLSATFDVRLLAQIDAVNESQRAEARQRVEQELQENLRALSRRWRRTLAFVIPGIIGGIALALALAGYFDASGLTGKLATLGADGLGANGLGGNVSSIQMLLTGLMGAAIGGVMSGWMARAAD